MLKHNLSKHTHTHTIFKSLICMLNDTYTVESSNFPLFLHLQFALIHFGHFTSDTKSQLQHQIIVFLAFPVTPFLYITLTVIKS